MDQVFLERKKRRSHEQTKQMMLQQVKVFRPDADGNLKLVRVISQKEVIRQADKNITKSKSNWKKKREIKRNENK